MSTKTTDICCLKQNGSAPYLSGLSFLCIRYEEFDNNKETGMQSEKSEVERRKDKNNDLLF